MNIFVLSEDPTEAAQMACDKHVIKMILESMQLLVTALRMHGIPESRIPLNNAGMPYKSTHHNHPCNKWVRTSRSNFLWLLEHMSALCKEYTLRYGKAHTCEKWIPLLITNQDIIPDGPLTEFAIAMPTSYIVKSCAVQSYREYYRREKARFATWKPPRSVPDWFVTH